ncbi:hypothetical protein EV142_102497 [Flavobacterium circumlabens]|uniref:Uncharacterized protein n=1 Tax=Flavobacterium circumlabens TaxID=2133765 RepID=A0ABY2B2K5_9FLAO|nr:hypothetical protein EV142_102497 [Flavobacterium circumlabens]
MNYLFDLWSANPLNAVFFHIKEKGNSFKTIPLFEILNFCVTYFKVVLITTPACSIAVCTAGTLAIGFRSP